MNIFGIFKLIVMIFVAYQLAMSLYSKLRIKYREGYKTAKCHCGCKGLKGLLCNCKVNCPCKQFQFNKTIIDAETTKNNIEYATDLYLLNFAFDNKIQFMKVAKNNGIVIINKLYAYASTFASSTKTELGIPTGIAPITPAMAALVMLLLKYAIPATVSPPIKNCPGMLLINSPITDVI